MNSGKLDKDMITQHELWKLTLMLSDDRIDVALYPPVSREEMIWRTFEFDRSTPDRLRALEDVIYDNPLLLSDFKRVDCIIGNSPSILLPKAIGEERMPEIYRQSTAGNDTGSNDSMPEIEIYQSGDPETCVVLQQEKSIRSFITRTFYNVRFDSRIASLCRFFTGRAEAPQSPAVYAIDHDNKLTLIATGTGHRLLMANEFRYKTAIDAVYYILAAMQQLKLDPETTAVSVSSTHSSAAGSGTLHEIIRKYLPYTGALPFPTLRYRASRTTLQAPFDLLIRPICE